jgi:hypothetical protein
MSRVQRATSWLERWLFRIPAQPTLRFGSNAEATTVAGAVRHNKIARPMTGLGHELPHHLAERAAVMPPKAAAPSGDQGGRGGPKTVIGPLSKSDRDTATLIQYTQEAGLSWNADWLRSSPLTRSVIAG